MLKFERFKEGVAEKPFSAIIDDIVTGMVIEDSLNTEECEMFIKVIQAIKPYFFHDLNSGNGYSLPGMFGQLHKTQPEYLVHSYFMQIEDFCKAASSAANINIVMWLHEKISRYFTPYKCAPLPGFLPFSFRVVFPKHGGLFIHQDGQLLPFIHDEVSKKIHQYILSETMMSWYFTLQNPESGGELWVADSRYFSYSKDGQFDMKSPEGNKMKAEDMDHIKVNTPTGSLLMFKGGSYWHKVIPPADNACDRITLGGFMAQGLDKQTIYYWS